MFRPKGFSYSIAAAALLMTTPGARAQETAPLEPAAAGQEAMPSLDVIVAPVTNVSFEEPVDLSSVTFDGFGQREREEEVQSRREEEESNSDELVVRAVRRTPINVEVPEQFTRNEFNAGAQRIVDDYLSIRGDSTTWRVGDGGNLFEVEWRWGDTDGDREGIADRMQTPIEEEADWERR